jgi:hypothetical protein
VLPGQAIAFHGVLKGIQQILIVKRFGKELDCSGLHHLHRHGHIRVPGDKDDGNMYVRLGHFILQIKTAHSRHAHVKNQAPGYI